MNKVINNQLINELTNEVLNSNTIQTYLDIVARCHHLSYMNQLLVYKQCPTSTIIMGKVAWESLGSSITPGSIPIALLYPHIVLTDPGTPMTDESGAALQEKGTGTAMYIKDPNYATSYKTVYAFDIRQTDRHIREDEPCRIEFIDRIKLVSPLTVAFVEKDELVVPHDKGQYVETEKEIQILQGLSDSESNAIAAKMFVEYHIDNALLKTSGKLGPEYQYLEIIKLLCSYCVSKHFGINNKQNSFIYVNKLEKADVIIKKKILLLVSTYVNDIIQELEGWSLTFNETAILNSILYSVSYSELASSLTIVGERIKNDKLIFSSLNSVVFKLLHSETGYLSQLFNEKCRQTLYSYPPYPVEVDANYFESLKTK